MKLDNLVAVSGMSGIYRIASSRNNGIVVEDLDTGKKKFVAARKHQFTPLETVGIFTMRDSVELSKVFHRMLDQYADNPPVPPKSPANDLTEYFEDILPEYDPDRVMISDIKKVIKWFTYLHERGMLADSGDEEE